MLGARGRPAHADDLTALVDGLRTAVAEAEVAEVERRHPVSTRRHGLAVAGEAHADGLTGVADVPGPARGSAERPEVDHRESGRICR